MSVLSFNRKPFWISSYFQLVIVLSDRHSANCHLANRRIWRLILLSFGESSFFCLLLMYCRIVIWPIVVQPVEVSSSSSPRFRARVAKNLRKSRHFVRTVTEKRPQLSWGTKKQFRIKLHNLLRLQLYILQFGRISVRVPLLRYTRYQCIS